MKLFLVFVTFFIWSTSFILGKKALAISPPLFLTSFRMLLAGILILLFLFLFRREQCKVQKKHLFPLFLLGLTSVYITNALEFWGLQYLTSAKACFIYSLSPFLSTIFSYFQFKEKITWKKGVGLLVGFLGFLPVLFTRSGAEELIKGNFSLSLPEIALMIATVTSVYGWILLRKLGKEESLSPVFANGVSMVLGGVMALIHSLIQEPGQPWPVHAHDTMAFFTGVGLMILISNFICYNLYGYLLKHFTATFLSFAGLMTPLFAAFFGWLFLKETVSGYFFFSIGIIFLGLWLVYAEELRLGYIYVNKEKPLPKEEGVV